MMVLLVGGLAWGACNRSGNNQRTATNHDHHDHGHDHGDGDSHDEETEQHVFTKAQAASIAFQVTTISTSDFRQVIKATGTLTAPTGSEVIVAAPSTGIISYARKDLSEGAPIQSGVTIASVSARNIAEGDPQARLRAQYETAERAFRRAENLRKEQLISQRAYEEASLNYETAKSAYHGLAGASSDGGIRIASTITGYLKNRFVEEGGYVTVGQPIATVTSNKRLRLRAEVSQKHHASLPLVRSANFKLPYTDQVYELDSLGGQLTAVGVSTEPTSPFLPVSFELDNIGNLPIGSYVEVYLLTNPIPNALVIPKTALLEEQGIFSVYIQTGESTFRKQPVSLGEDNGKQVRVLSGIVQGNRVVTAGALYIKLANMNAAIPHGHSH